MASIVYPIIIFIFIFGAGMTYINETNLYAVKMPETGVQSNLSQASQLNTALTETSKSSQLSSIDQMYIIGSSVVGGLMAIFTLGPLLISMGVPVGLAGWFLSPMGFVIAMWVIEMWTGRPAE